MKRIFGILVGAWVLFFFLAPPAHALNVIIARIQSGKVQVVGNKAAKSANISWEGAVVTKSTAGGTYNFNKAAVPPTCVGKLTDGVETLYIPVQNCVPTAFVPAGASIGVPQTGQTQCYDGVTPGDCPNGPFGQDGDFQAGVELPSPRFTVNNPDGTVMDNLTGLIWLQLANCGVPKNWADALDFANNLAHGQCDLTDGSVAGDWRLPNLRELQSLVDYENFNRALPDPTGAPFTNFQSGFYWSSTTYAFDPVFAWGVHFSDGDVLTTGNKTVSFLVLPVRGGSLGTP